MDEFPKTAQVSPPKYRESAYKRDMYQTQDSKDVKVIYAGKNGGFSNKVLKVKASLCQNNNGDIDVLSDMGSDKSRSSSFYFGNGTSNQKMKHHFRDSSIGKRQTCRSKNNTSMDFVLGSPILTKNNKNVHFETNINQHGTYH